MANNTNGGVVPIPGPPRLPPVPLFPFMNASMNYASICALAHCVSFSLKLWFCGEVVFFIIIIVIAAHPVDFFTERDQLYQLTPFDLHASDVE